MRSIDENAMRAEPWVVIPSVVIPGVVIPGVVIPGVAIPGVAIPGAVIPSPASKVLETTFHRSGSRHHESGP